MIPEFAVDFNAGTVTHRTGVVFELRPFDGGYDLVARQDTLRFLPRELYGGAAHLATRAMEAFEDAKRNQA